MSNDYGHFEEHFFVSGHTACAGCGQSMAARIVADVAGKNTIVTNATGCLEVFSTKAPETSWRVPWIHSLFENSAAIASGVEAALRHLGKIDTIRVIAQGGDGGTADIGLQALSGMLERGHDILYICYDNEAYMNCLSRDSLIMCKEGLKNITEVKLGEEIYAFDQKSHQPVLKKCSGIFDNGVKDVYELQTLHHTIKATSNHPFLIVSRAGRGRETTLIWKTLAELKKGDEVIALRNLDEGESFKFNFQVQNKYQNFLIDNKYFTVEKITDIKLIGKEETLDLRVEDEHNFIADGIVVHNTGIQRSGLTPLEANTTTSPVGSSCKGNWRSKKPLLEICAAHFIPYAATASVGYIQDLQRKVKKALSIRGPKYIQVHVPCPLGWGHESKMTLEVAKAAVACGLYPLAEYENGKIANVFKISTPKPVVEYIKTQTRFKHLLKDNAALTALQDVANRNIEYYGLIQK
jgi:pyruvate/2-oxoacid:ferredoxin oxidoreductase beta subunit